jgi:alpha-tubulin suppressor-like RCC1 family protein
MNSNTPQSATRNRNKLNFKWILLFATVIVAIVGVVVIFRSFASSQFTVKAMTGGEKFNCGIKNNTNTNINEIFCWGLNDQGQLGEPTAGFSSFKPIKVKDISNATQLSAYANSTCSVLADKTVKCWGGNYGKVPKSIAGINNASQVATGTNHSCAVLLDKTVKCWGVNDAGQLGNNSRVSSDNPVSVANISTATQVSSGSNFSCARLENGTIVCWGSNDGGQLGNNSRVSSNTPVLVNGINTATQVSNGEFHSCAVLSGGSLRCWGWNASGQLGSGQTGAESSSNTPRNVNISSVSQISLWKNRSCARLTDETIRCWGTGPLGNRENSSSASPNQVFVGKSKQVSNSSSPCAVKSDNRVACWGDDLYGEVAKDNSSNFFTKPTILENIGGTIKEISNGNDFSCAIYSDDKIKCWGVGTAGKLGNNDTNNNSSNIPVVVAGLPAGVPKQIVSGNGHSCALYESSIYCWGWNGAGQLGNGSNADSNKAVQVSNINPNNKPIQITAGNNFTCALFENKTAQCWGFNADGALGDGSLDNSNRPKIVGAPLQGIKQLSSGSFHTCALLDNNTVNCWGWNGENQLGIGSNLSLKNSSPRVVPTANLSGVSQISAGERHNCAVLQDGRARCWGGNAFGQLGNNTKNDASLPVAVNSSPGLQLNDAKVISANKSTTCLITTTNVLKCWGSNSVGQLGVSNLNESLVPINAGQPDTNKLKLAQSSKGDNYNCTILNDNSPRCRGFNAGNTSAGVFTKSRNTQQFNIPKLVETNDFGSPNPKNLNLSKTSNSIKLTWDPFDSDIDQYYIQRWNGSNYATIGAVSGKQNLFTDSKPLNGRNFYRLVAVDASGNDASSSNSIEFGFKGSMGADKRLNPGETLLSNNGRYRLIMQNDGNLVVYSPSRALWNSRTQGRAPEFFTLQNDGNLVLYGKNIRAYWTSNSQGKGGKTLVMQDDGNLVLYTAQNRPVWNSGTNGK